MVELQGIIEALIHVVFDYGFVLCVLEYVQQHKIKHYKKYLNWTELNLKILTPIYKLFFFY